MRDIGHFIGGKQVPGASGRTGNVHNPATGEVTYTSAGHNPPVLVRAAGGYELLTGGSVMLGILPMARYEAQTIKLEKGDVLVMFSDGVTEAVNPKDERYTSLVGKMLILPVLNREIPVSLIMRGNSHDRASAVVA